MTALGPRTVTVHYQGGPEDGWSRPYMRGAEPMPDLVAGYRLIGPHAFEPDVWLYAWVPPRTGKREPCRAGAQGCLGSRCPSRRQRQTA